MPYSSKDIRALAVLLVATTALILAVKLLPDGALWVITIVAGFFAYRVCSKLGWMALVLTPFFPFLVFVLELDRPERDHYPVAVVLSAWTAFALFAAVGAWRWWKRLRST